PINVAGHVRYRGQSGKHMLIASFSAFDPKRTLHKIELHFCDRDERSWSRRSTEPFRTIAQRSNNAWLSSHPHLASDLRGVSTGSSSLTVPTCRTSERGTSAYTARSARWMT